MVGGFFLLFFLHARIKTLGEEQNDWVQGKYSLGSAKCATLLMALSSSSPGSQPAAAAAACICLPHESLGGAEAHTYFGKAIASAEIRGGPIITVISRPGQADARRGRVLAVTLHPHVTPGCNRIAAAIWCGKKRGAGSERFEL